ncbi:MAG: cell division protein FtsA [Armatimonadetes bacterium RBG_16_58_9]|nr:MAG: cell division protein FtsA [Armatimonadetes bacterium RBG_16_58_9]
MSRKEFIAGLDIGTTKTCCVLADVDLDQGSVDIIGVGLAPSDGLRRGVVVDLDATTQAIRTAVDKAQQMAGNVLIRSVVVGVTGEHISSLNSRGVIAITSPEREITASDVERVVEASKVIVLPPEREIVHSIPRGFTVDGQDGVKDPVGMSGGRLEVETHIVTGSTSFLDNVAKCVQRAGLTIDVTVLEPIATSESSVIPAEKDLGVALLDIGGGTTDVAVFTAGEIYYTAVLPVGGNHVTNDIAVGLRAAREEAERAKIDRGCAVGEMVEDGETFKITSLGAEKARELPREILAKIIEPRMQEIFQMAREELMKSGYLEMLPAGTVLSGGGAMMPGSIDMAEKILGMPVRLGLPRDVGGLKDTVASPIYATGVGLVMHAARHQADLREEEKGVTLRQGLKDIFKRFFS